ncbi:choline/ethanolamine kinase [Gregarina niphandrodes]|uniref:Choline/ethanolamine kinase n=1 Tax=Gregarina niphandrodes TaxID=110365 RepID=A0A023B1L1_GRENI|nr:choline/ethanolamine kinase [Gregarina niphandrodes]EZG48169.1 choline/ethanolamine kinase [Gregarina niphandrodes]|eukprot:XP_011132127.1 choline/ethanolamine kinase [Gregarina niphandrodes]
MTKSEMTPSDKTATADTSPDNSSNAEDLYIGAPVDGVVGNDLALKEVHTLTDLNAKARDFSRVSDPKRIKEICCERIPSWSGMQMTPDDVQVEQIMAGLTNQLFSVFSKRPEVVPAKVLFRVYGDTVADLYDTNFEVEVFKTLAANHAAPKFIAEFNGGRIEEYINGPALLVKEMGNPSIVTAIANILSKFHRLHLHVPEMQRWKSDTAWVFDAIHRWGKKAARLVELAESEALRQDAPVRRTESFGTTEDVLIDKSNLMSLAERKSMVKNLEQTGVTEMLKEIDHIEELCLPSHIDRNHPLVALAFCHNDTQENNILCTGTRLRLIDFEYSNFSHPAFDIANFFCEMTMDYCHPDPPYYTHKSAPEDFPQDELIRLFGSVYLSAVTGETVLPADEQLNLFVEIVHRFALASHLMWGFWSIIRAPQAATNSDFDFLLYAKSRFDAYRMWKDRRNF